MHQRETGVSMREQAWRIGGAVLLCLCGMTGARAELNAQGTSNAGIPVHFKLEKAGEVTLVIDDAGGKRVRNLVAETHFEAGEHVVYWDGRDESGGVKADAAGLYRTTGKAVAAGTYRVQGLVHDPIRLQYEFSVYTAGSPPWRTRDNRGRWLADHTPPIDALLLPARGDTPARVLVAAYVAEGGDALIWTDLEGHKLDGVRWVGGNWTGALALARDDGPKAVQGTEAYAASSWLVTDKSAAGQKKMIGELRLTALSGHEGRAVWTERFNPAPFAQQGPLPVGQVRASEKRYVGGVAARDGLVALSLVRQGELRFIDDRLGRAVGSVKLADTRGLTFDAQGRLLVLVGKQLRRYAVSRTAGGVSLEGEQVVVGAGLENPDRLMVDAATGQIYISDWGSNTVKVFTADGQAIRVIGTPGGVPVGHYDPSRMENPSGMALMPDGTLWVAEENYAPKRVSLWSKEGQFLKALYGPPQYGGGGNLSADKKTFYYFDNRGMAFDLDWATGKWSLRSVYYDPAKDTLGLYVPRKSGKQPALGLNGGPQAPIDLGGRRYLTNVFNGGETDEVALAAVWLEAGDVARPVAVVGDASDWPLMYEARFRSRLPEGVDLSQYVPGRSPVLVAWSDANGDGQVQVEEVSSQMLKNFGSKTHGTYRMGRIFIGADLGFTTSFTYQLKPHGFTAAGVPLYDAAEATAAFRGPIDLNFAEGHDAVTAGKDFTVVAGSPVRGFKDGQLWWTYPNAWAGLHPGHKAPPRQYSGQLIATTKVLGLPVVPRGSDAGAIWAYNGDRGDVYLMTMDGLFVSQLFQIPSIDAPKVARWEDVPARRGMEVGQYNVPGENFLPTINQTTDGQVYLVTGKEHSSLVHVMGLETIRRLPESTVEVSGMPAAAGGDAVAAGTKDDGVLHVAQLGAKAKVDGKLGEWSAARWVSLDGSTQAAVGIAGDRLMLAYRTNDADLLNNKPESLPMLFKTGGALDLMLRTDPAVKAGQREPVAGDVRLLVTEVDGKPVAVLYRPVARGQKNPVAFSSPWRTLTFDRVEEVSAAARVARVGGDYECSIPLKSLGLTLPAGVVRLRGDVGLLRGQPGQTTQRLYWHNKETGIVEDVPSEAALQPGQWGTLVFGQ
jgi:hypothetical protein